MHALIVVGLIYGVSINSAVHESRPVGGQRR